MKKKILLVLSVTFVLSGLMYSASAQSSLSNGLVGYWKFDSIGTNRQIDDSSGNGNTGTVGTNARLVSGISGQALRFDAGQRLQHMAIGRSFSANTWSVSTWINPDRPIPAGAPYHGIITVFSGFPELFSITRYGVSMFRNRIASYDFHTNTGWKHVVLTYDGTNLKTFVDGAQIGSVATTTNMMSTDITRFIGTNGAANAGHIFVGAIDEVRLYNRALSNAEISTLFSSVTPTTPTTPPAPVTTPAPTTRLTNTINITTDKNTYRLGEVVNMTANFTVNSDWVTWLRNNNITQGELKFLIKDPTNRMLVERTHAFDISTSPVSIQYTWQTPTNTSLAGISFSLETQVYDANKTKTETNTKTGLSFENTFAPVATPVNPNVIVSRLPAGVSPHLFGKILAERDLKDSFAVPFPFVFRKNSPASTVKQEFVRVKDNGTIDLSRYNAVHFVVENKSNNELTVNFLPYSANLGLNFRDFGYFNTFYVPPNSGIKHILVHFEHEDCELENGMDKCPVGPDQVPHLSQPKVKNMDFTRFAQFVFNVGNLPANTDLVIHQVKAVDISYKPNDIPGLIDRWGQNNWLNFTDKITSDQQLRNEGSRETTTLNPLPANTDTYGGDTRYSGYQATGFFRTQKVDGKWWLVSPQGNLFYLKSFDWVLLQTWGTSLKDRTQLFSNIPPRSGLFSQSYRDMTCQPSNHDVTGTRPFCGGVNWFGYYSNVVLKYYRDGSTTLDEIRQKWGISTTNRLRDWGFNAILTSGVAPQEIRMPYTLNAYFSQKVQKITGTNVADPFHPEFKNTINSFAQTFATVWNRIPSANINSNTDPYLIGVYADNEIPWGLPSDRNNHRQVYNLILDTLKQNGNSVYAKKAFTDKLQVKYGSVSALRSAWGQSLSGVNSWADFNTQSINPSGTLNSVLVGDLSMLLTYIAEEYFSSARSAIKAAFPNHLFMGSRFAGFYRSPPEVLDACVKYCDVLSFNYYGRRLTDVGWDYLLTKDKPILISEFQIGIHTRGAADGGHYQVFDEGEAGEEFEGYVRDALSKYQIVGYSWSGLVDKAISGINALGENSYSGFLTITDQPKTELVNKARTINSRVFSLRNARAANGTSPTPAPVTTYTATVGVMGQGTVTGTGINCGNDCSETVNSGTTITLTANQSAGSVFTGWSGACTNTTGSCVLSMTANRVVTANFTRTNTAPVPQPVTVNTNGSPVTINLVATDAENNPIRFNTGLAPTRGTLVKVSEGRYTYTPNTPHPSTSYIDGFNYNATDGSTTSPATRVTINYTPRQYVLSVTKTVGGTVTGTGINCGIDCNESMATGRTNTLTATSIAGYRFTGWTGACTNTTGTCTVTMTQDRSVNANFAIINTAPVAQNASYTVTNGTPFEITLTANDAERNTLTYTPSTLSTSRATLTKIREGVYRYALRTPLPTSAVTDTFTFTARDGSLTSAPATVSVVFTPTAPTQFSLNTSSVGSGKITGTGIDCGIDCNERVNSGTNIVLTATPVAGHRFTGWTGACTNTTGTCTVLLNSDKSVAATFIPIPPADSDGDGVPDSLDRCPQTPANLRSQVNSAGCVPPRVSRFNIRPPVQDDVTNVNNVEIGITGRGKISFTEPVVLSRPNDVLDLDTNVIIEEGRVEVKSAVIPELNKPAVITLYNVDKVRPRILKNGSPCTAPECNIESYENGVLTFTVSGFSIYTVDETPDETQPTTEPQEDSERRSRGGGGGSRITPVSEATLVEQLTAQLNALIAQLNSIMTSRAQTTSVPNTSGKFNVTLARGSRHPDVKRLQQRLTALGYRVPATGYYGPLTVAAVKKLQAANGIRQTGVAGALTRAVLNR